MNKRGRPNYNIFSKRKNPPNKVRTFRQSFPIQSLVIDVRQNAWRRDFPKTYNAKYVAWSNTVEPGDDFRTPFYHAERAMLLCGRKLPEKRYNSEGIPVRDPSFYDTFLWFRDFCHEVVNGTTKTAVAWERRGQKPDPEKIYRTAVSVLTARRLIKHSGGDPWFIPTSIAISQVWEVLFNEQEDPDSIRKRMPAVTWFCYKFAREPRFNFPDDKNPIYKLSRTLEKQYPEFMPKKLTREEIAALDEAEEIAFNDFLAVLFKVYGVPDDELIDTTEIPYREDLYIPRK